VPTTQGSARQPDGADAPVPLVASELPWLAHLQLTVLRRVVGPLRRRFWRKRQLPPPLSGEEILRRLVDLPVSTWSYEYEPGVRHLGPMAQDFAAAFGLGRSNRVIDMTDTNGVNVIALQALARRVFALESQLAQLEGRAGHAASSGRVADAEMPDGDDTEGHGLRGP